MADPNIGNATVGDIYQVMLACTLYSQRLRTVLHYRLEDAPVSTPRWSFYDTIQGRVIPTEPASPLSKIRAIQSEDVAWEYLQIQLVHPTRRMYRRYTLVTAGTTELPAGATNVAAYVEKRSDVPGRHGIGGVHVGGVPAQLAEDGQWNAATQSKIDDIRDDLLTEFVDEVEGYTLIPCLAPYPGLVGSPGDVVDAVSYYDVRTMRRRNLRVGE